MTIHHTFNLQVVDESWQECLLQALHKIDPAYLTQLTLNKNWLPGPEKIFNAFSMPVNKINYVLFGESPYPRAASANGYAFWDAAVKELWSSSGLSKTVNRATSLRNIIKMLLIAEGALTPQKTSQENIVKIDKRFFTQTNNEFFNNLLDKGFLLLNATLVLQEGKVQKDARAWQPFLKYVLEFLFKQRPQVQLILLGRIANEIDKLVDHFEIKRLYAEHPYNISFITNPTVLDFFKPFHLLVSSTTNGTSHQN
jgi:uracil-DNA glycosylase